MATSLPLHHMISSGGTYMKGAVHVPPLPTILPQFATRNTSYCVCTYTGHAYRLSRLNFNMDMMCVFVRAWVGILRISTDICNLLSVDFLLLIPCTFLYQYIFRQKPFMTQYTEHTQKLLHVSTSRCHLQWVTMKQNADLLNNLLIYHKLAGWPVHLCHSNSLKMATGCWNM